MKSKVSIVKCASYEPGRIKEAVKKSLDLIGGLNIFMKGRRKVLLKPNLLSARLPEDAVGTHPEFVRGVGRLVKEAGGSVYIGDSPGSFATVKSVDDVYEKSGMKKMAAEEGFTLIKFDKVAHITAAPSASAFKEYDLVINLPKMKTHTLAILTGAVKNMYGLIPGLSKVQYHKAAPNIREFSKILADIFAIVKPHLSIMDGVVGMEGDGPAAGQARELGLILAAADAVSLDAVFSHIAGFPYTKNCLLKEVTERGLGAGRIKDIEIAGEDLYLSRIKNFKLPGTELLYRFPSWFSRPLASLIKFRPIINEAICRKCGICQKACPADAITINKTISKIDKHKCITCFCCHEVCPHDAIYIKKNIFSRMIWR